MKILKHREDLGNFIRAAIALPILVIPLFFEFPEDLIGILIGSAIWFLLSDMNFLLHQHVHNELTRYRFINWLVDWALSIVTGMSAFNWRISHIERHHKGVTSWGDGYQWEMEKPTVLGAVSYSVRGIPVILFCPVWESMVRIASSKETKFPFRLAFFEQAVVIAVMLTFIWQKPQFYFSYYFAVLFFSRLTDYENHVGCDESSEYGFSNNCLNANYNKVRQNFGLHTAHHYFQNAHWTELPLLHEGIQDRIPAKCKTNRAWTGYWTPPGLVLFFQLLFASSLRSRISRGDESV